MRSDTTSTVTIGSFLTGGLEDQVLAHISQVHRYRYCRLDETLGRGLLAAEAGATAIMIEQDIDVVLLPTSSADLTRWRRQCSGRWFGGGAPPSDQWERPPAIVAVLSDDSLHDAVRAAQLDFEGILAEPFSPAALEQCFTAALARRDQRVRLSQRHNKVRRLCRDLNRQRRRLRHKVDLLCQDLVESNQGLNHRVEELRLAHDFQSSLTGQFDLQYVLHMSLQRMKKFLPESSGAAYLFESGLFEAHLAGAWYQDAGDITEIEDAFRQTAVAAIAGDGAALRIDDAGAWPAFNSKLRESLAGLSLVALPLRGDSNLIGVVIFYRSADTPFTSDDQQRLRPYLDPLSRAVAAILKLQRHLATL